MTKEIKKVKIKLWKYGYGVRDYSEHDVGFDLLVNKKFRVIVSLTEPLSIPNECDVVAVVKSGKVLYFTRPGASPVKYRAPYDIFGRPKKK